MKKLLPLFHLLLFFNSSFSQVTFQKAYGGNLTEEGYCVRPTMDGGLVVLGITRSFGTGGDLYLIKTDSLGNLLWTKTYSAGGTPQSFDVEENPDSTLMLLGIWNADDNYVIKTNKNGDTLWTRTYGASNIVGCYSIQRTNDKGYMIGGWRTGPGTDYDVYLTKLDSMGNHLWSKDYGGTGPDVGTYAQQTFDGGYIVCGRTGSYGAGSSDIYLVRIDSAGNLLWSKTYGGAAYDLANCIRQTGDSGFIVTGSTQSFGQGLEDLYVMKTDSSGNIQWCKTYGGNSYEGGINLQITSDGGYIVAGYTSTFGSGNYDAYLIKINSIGDTAWTKTFGGTNYDYGESVIEWPDHGFILAGTTYSSITDGAIYLIKTDTAGHSGCYEHTASTIIGTAAFQVLSPPTTVRNSGTVLTTHNKVVNSGGVSTSLCISLGNSFGEQMNEPDFIIRPNPAHNSFSIDFPILIQGCIQIYDLTARLIYQQSIINQESEIINNNLTPGIYFVRINDGKREEVQKLVIE